MSEISTLDHSTSASNSVGSRRAPRHEFRAHLLACVTSQDTQEVMAVLVSQAKQGNLSAIRLFLAYAIGKPTDKDDPAQAAAKADTSCENVANAPVAVAPNELVPIDGPDPARSAGASPTASDTSGVPAPIPSKPKASPQGWTDRHVDAMIGLLDTAKAAAQTSVRDGVPPPTNCKLVGRSMALR